MLGKGYKDIEKKTVIYLVISLDIMFRTFFIYSINSIWLEVPFSIVYILIILYMFNEINDELLANKLLKIKKW